MQLCDETHVTWNGRFRPTLTGQGVYPRPVQDKLPIWLGVGGTPDSIVRAGTLGLPLMIAIIGGRFAPASRAQFNALCGPDGAFLVGSPQTVRDNMIAANATMGGISRITLQMSTAMLDTAQMQKSITLRGEQVARKVKSALAAL